MKTRDRLALLTLTAGGLGLMKPASGTWGSTPPPALFGLLMLAGVSLDITRGVIVLVLVLSCVLCVALTRWGEAKWGKKDAGQIVIDEVAGQCIPLLVLPAVAEPLSMPGFTRLTVMLAAAFLLFRLFDIAKLQPANAAQQLPHGWGVLVDALVAGVYAAIVLLIGLHFLG